MRRLTATEAARRFSDVLDAVADRRRFAVAPRITQGADVGGSLFVS